MPSTNIDRPALEDKVKRMYTEVASNPRGPFHFEIFDAAETLFQLGFDGRGLFRTLGKRLARAFIDNDHGDIGQAFALFLAEHRVGKSRDQSSQCDCAQGGSS